MPSAVDLRPSLPPKIWQQGRLGSCTANATGIQLWALDKTDPVEPSRAFQYYNTRLYEGTTSWDSGASIRNAIKAAVRYGYCAESLWPYSVEDFAVKPPLRAYSQARTELVSEYARVGQTATQLRGCLASGYTVNFGFSVYTSFLTIGASGVMPMPRRSERVEGGHAVLMVGYDDARERYTVRNSWGPDWGDKGYFYMPYAFAHSSAASDFWTVFAVP